jgi:hypothetical protein
MRTRRQQAARWLGWSCAQLLLLSDADLHTLPELKVMKEERKQERRRHEEGRKEERQRHEEERKQESQRHEEERKDERQRHAEERKEILRLVTARDAAAAPPSRWRRASLAMRGAGDLLRDGVKLYTTVEHLARKCSSNEHLARTYSNPS